MCFCILDLFLTGLDIPDSPGSDNLHLGSECLDSKLETNLIVALTCAAVADSICAFSLCNLNNSLCDNGTCKGCAEEVILLVNCACLECGEDVLVYKLFLKVLDVELGSACSDCLLLKTVKLCALTDITGYCDNFAVVVVFFEPGDDDGCIKTARVV